ncbi:hypothetical protein [Chryseobacterium sp. PMSZPI]|uniref:hypothetical protein n=1 Tax=Chryseobacterium sp. PMSZPI TaxID=1033900 RepID=UPI001E3A46ED|nr:hypothetical protein [Chryseobacterium sp. PMSZPI]
MSGFSSDFSMLNGDGVSITLAMFSDWLPTVFGQFPDRSVQIEDVEIHYSNDHGLATFTEIQITGTVSNQRSSSAVFLLTQEKALWFHLIEKWI